MSVLPLARVPTQCIIFHQSTDTRISLKLFFTIDGALSILESKLLGGLIVKSVGLKSHLLNFSASLGSKKTSK